MRRQRARQLFAWSVFVALMALAALAIDVMIVDVPPAPGPSSRGIQWPPALPDCDHVTDHHEWAACMGVPYVKN